MEQVGGLYDRCVIGGGDSAFLAALFGLDRPCGHRPLDEDIARWAGRLRSTRARAGYVAGTVCHLYHGNMSKRRYAQRHLVLAEHAYDPRRDVYPLGAALEWATLKPGLHRAVREYFAGRREDEPWADESGGRKLHLPG